jgi:mucolipin 3
MFALISIGRYIEYNENYSTIYVTINKAFPVVIRYLIGMSPIAIGFILFGICVFWESDNFANFSIAANTLFAMVQGDLIFDTLQNLKGVSFFIGQIYCYAFCLTFIM